ncbi:hypothetical protein MAHJHV51_29940 [Mycobacterium avium subsp. hominissuis]
MCGRNGKAVWRMLENAKASMTLDTYTDMFDEDLDDVADRLDTAFRPLGRRKCAGGTDTF